MLGSDPVEGLPVVGDVLTEVVEGVTGVPNPSALYNLITPGVIINILLATPEAPPEVAAGVEGGVYPLGIPDAPPANEEALEVVP